MTTEEIRDLAMRYAEMAKEKLADDEFLRVAEALCERCVRYCERCSVEMHCNEGCWIYSETIRLEMAKDQFHKAEEYQLVADALQRMVDTAVAAPEKATGF